MVGLPCAASDEARATLADEADQRTNDERRAGHETLRVAWATRPEGGNSRESVTPAQACGKRA
jgi:hypothetical protein